MTSVYSTILLFECAVIWLDDLRTGCSATLSHGAHAYIETAYLGKYSFYVYDTVVTCFSLIIPERCSDN
jgi:hypothetical protein